MGNNICKNVSKNVSGKYNQKLLDLAKQPAMLPWSANCFIVARTANNHKLAFTIADTKLYVPAVQQLKAGFRRAIN